METDLPKDFPRAQKYSAAGLLEFSGSLFHAVFKRERVLTYRSLLTSHAFLIRQG